MHELTFTVYFVIIFEIKGEKKGEADVVDACFRPGATQGGGVEEGNDALSRLKEKIKKHLLN